MKAEGRRLEAEAYLGYALTLELRRERKARGECVSGCGRAAWVEDGHTYVYCGACRYRNLQLQRAWAERRRAARAAAFSLQPSAFSTEEESGSPPEVGGRRSAVGGRSSSSPKIVGRRSVVGGRS